MDRIIVDDPYENYSRKELKKRKKKIIKWYDRLTSKKDKKYNKTRDILREDEI